MHTLLKYEFRKKVNECKPLQYLIHNVVERNIDVITQREYDVVRGGERSHSKGF